MRVLRGSHKSVTFEIRVRRGTICPTTNSTPLIPQSTGDSTCDLDMRPSTNVRSCLTHSASSALRLPPIRTIELRRSGSEEDRTRSCVRWSFSGQNWARPTFAHPLPSSGSSASLRVSHGGYTISTDFKAVKANLDKTRGGTRVRILRKSSSWYGMESMCVSMRSSPPKQKKPLGERMRKGT